MTQDVGAPSLVLFAWVAAGLLSLAGALTYAELGAMLPNAGGEYVYLRQSYGDLAAFLFGWQRFIVAGSASIASLGSGFAIFLAAFLPLNAVWAERELHVLGQDLLWQFGPRQLVAVGAIFFLSVVNCLAVAFGGKVQSALTILKIGGIAFVVLGIFFFSGSADWSHLRTPAGTPGWSGWAALRDRDAGGALGFRRLEQHADGGGRGAGPRPQHSARAHPRDARGHGRSTSWPTSPTSTPCPWRRSSTATPPGTGPRCRWPPRPRPLSWARTAASWWPWPSSSPPSAHSTGRSSRTRACPTRWLATASSSPAWAS